jgi:hypothetical protein
MKTTNGKSHRSRFRPSLKSMAYRSRVTNGSSLFIESISKNSPWYRRLRDLVAAYASDLGGTAHLSEGQKALIRRAAMLQLQCELVEQAWAEGGGDASPKALDRYGRTTNTLRRTLEALGLQQGRLPRAVNGRQIATARVIEDIRERYAP